ncbi:MAG: rhodanese-like domain-containing protein [Xanthomonadales bacterium]|uniref:rhodanese-like domain-containing protein n=1 Tax=Thermomonas TaxID=141948 RepID=UPI001AC51E25|nr:rhodanese-like domain-containing protein [Xanthomonadales bacterium]
MTLAELMAFAGRHPYLSLALGGLTVAIVYNEIAGRLSGIRRLGPAEVTALINHGNALLVDVRGASDFEKGHIAGSKNVQMTQFDPENKQLAPAKSLPVVMVCKVGQTASFAARRLRKAGFTDVAVLEGGIQAWQAADLPLVKGKR